MRLAVVLGLLLLLAGCGGGERVTQPREVAPFDRLEVADSIDVEVVPGDGREVSVYAGEAVMDRVHTESSGGVLRIDVRDRGIVIGPDPLGDVRVQVSASALEAIEISGTSDVRLEGIDAEQLEVEVEGAANVDASGTVERLTATIQGAGDANLADLAVRRAVVVVEGAADAELDVAESLDVRIEGAADVTYRGDPVVTQEIHGAGDIRRQGP